MVDQVVKVDCYSGASYAERPKALFWQGEKIKISQVLQSQQNPDARSFEVLLDNGLVVRLYYLISDDRWLAGGLPENAKIFDKE
jgi:hypothetical protein